VIYEGRHAAETLGSYEFFLIESAIRLAEYNVPFGWNAS
jgi:hypothetical protein